MPRPVSIVIPAFNQLDYCKQCIASIQANTDYPHRLILVDNGSTDGVGPFFDRVPNAIAIHAESNRGFAGGVNLGLARAEGHVLLLNSDTLVPKGWLARLVAALEQADDIGAVGPMSNYVAGPQLIPDLAFQALDDITAFAQDLARKNAGRFTEVDRLIGFCMLIREEAVEQVGTFDDSFGIGNYEDDDYCLRLRKAGYRLRIAHDAFVFHYGNRTFMGMGLQGERFDALLDENRRVFEEKWPEMAMDRTAPIRRSRALNQAAREALDTGDTTGAVRLLKDAIEACPLIEANFNDLGAVLWQMGEGGRAYENFARALRLNPAYPEARRNLLDAARALGRPADADALLGKAGDEP